MRKGSRTPRWRKEATCARNTRGAYSACRAYTRSIYPKYICEVYTTHAHQTRPCQPAGSPPPHTGTGTVTNMHGMPQNHPPHIHETTPKPTRKHTPQGNRRNGKGEHTEPSAPTRILKMIPKEPPQEHPTTRTSTHTRKATQTTKPPAGTATHANLHDHHQSRGKGRGKGRRCHPKGYTPRAGTRPGHRHGAGIVSWW